MPIFDVSVPIAPGRTPTYPGDPGIEIETHSSLSAGEPANVSMLHKGAHTATHMDAPAHFLKDAPKISALSLDTLIGPARVVEIPGDAREITAEHIAQAGLEGVTRALFKTRNSAFWENLTGEFREDYTYLTANAARALVERSVRLVGIDYLSVERFQAENFETHTTFLERGVVIIEGLDLRAVAAGDYELICLPLKIEGGAGDGAPARVVLRTLD